MADHQMIGKMGRVTGTIAPGKLGEVMVEVRGGSEAFHAYAADNDETIPVGTSYWVRRTRSGRQPRTSYRRGVSGSVCGPYAVNAFR